MSQRIEKIKSEISKINSWKGYDWRYDDKNELLSEIDRLTVAYDICEYMLNYDNYNIYKDDVRLFNVHAKMDLSDLSKNIKAMVRPNLIKR